ncbi:toxin-antitoxin system protein [Clostridium perfringens]|nr:toxin-antitoxin system protein [Clostridium perfringens]MDM0725981.1 toxin-antitoxin system protein [Clostridium perfringens]
MNLAKVKISITLDENIYKQVAKEAEADDRKVSQQINKILKDFFKEKGKI